MMHGATGLSEAASVVFGTRRAAIQRVRGVMAGGQRVGDVCGEHGFADPIGSGKAGAGGAVDEGEGEKIAR